MKSKEWPGSVTQSFCTNALPQPGFNMHKSEQQLIPTNTVSYLVCKINAHSSNTNTAGPGLITDRSFKLPDSNRHILPGVQGEHPQHQHQCLVSHYCMMVDSGRQSLPDVSDEHPHHQHKHSRVWSHITLYGGRHITLYGGRHITLYRGRFW